MTEEAEQNHKINKGKIYLVALLGFLFTNFVFETLITLFENQQQRFLYPIFPYTRIGLLIITVLVSNYYIRLRAGKPKTRLLPRIGKYLLIALVFYGLVIGSIFALDEAELERLRRNRPETPNFRDMMPEPYIFEGTE